MTPRIQVIWRQQVLSQQSESLTIMQQLLGILFSDPAVAWLGMYHFPVIINWCCENLTSWNLTSNITQDMTASSSCIVTYYQELSLH